MKSLEDWKKEYPQDDFCGSEFKTPKGGVLTVVGIASKSKNKIKQYACHCSICHSDEEMFPELETSPKNILVNQGSVPCACSKSYRCNDRQYRLRLRNDDYEVISTEEITGNSQKVKLRCNHDGYEWESDVSNLLNHGSGCPACAKSGYSPKKAGVFYVVHWHNHGKEFLKYGITNKGESRITNQMKSTDYTPTILYFPEFADGNVAAELERECDIRRNELYGNKGVVSKEEFEDGYTETMNIDQYDWINDMVFSNTMCGLKPLYALKSQAFQCY